MIHMTDSFAGLVAKEGGKEGGKSSKWRLWQTSNNNKNGHFLC